MTVMADEGIQDKAGWSGYMVPTLLALLALAGGLPWALTPLSSPRPAAQARESAAIARPQNVEARLWQDPLAAIDNAQRAAQSNGTNAKSPAAFHALTFLEMQEFLTQDAGEISPGAGDTGGLHVLLAMVPDGTYAEDAESRLRDREAVVSALSAAHYRAEDEEHIGALQLSWPRTVDRTPDKPEPDISTILGRPRLHTQEVLFPFERFRLLRNVTRIAGSQERALVIWLPASLFEGAPLERLSQLVEAVRVMQPQPVAKPLAAGETPSNKTSNLTIDILGPSGSSMLNAMLPRDPNDCAPATTNASKPLAGVHMFSWSATAMDGLLVKGWERTAPRDAIKCYLQTRWGLIFTNTIATDDELNAGLVEELKLRNVDLAKKDQHVVLLYEWDTDYARTLPLSFAAEVRRRQVHASQERVTGLTRAIADVLGSPATGGLVSGAVPNVHAFTYLRGIDGKIPGEQNDKRSVDSSSLGKNATARDQGKEDQAGMNTTEGPNQLDYMPRMALALREMREQIELGHFPARVAQTELEGGKDQAEPARTAGQLKAIGLMGSDFYDKLLILQALREHFPDVIFFTTDLDGRFVDPTVKKSTRNVVVSSSFGLTLDSAYQGSAPPFRSSYQTSLFVAALEGLQVIPPNLQIHAPPARRFEIGNLHAVDISTLEDGFHIQPGCSRCVNWRGLLLTSVIVLTVLLMLVLFVPPFRNTLLRYDREFQRQFPIFFTEKDILHPGAVAKHPEVAENFPVRRSSKQEPAVPSIPFSGQEGTTQTHHRTSIVDWLNSQLKDPRETTETVPGEDLRLLVGNLVPGWFSLRRVAPFLSRRRFVEFTHETARIARHRLAWEVKLSTHAASCKERCRLLNYKPIGMLIGAALITVVVLVFLCLLYVSHISLDGEPFSIVEGVSAWPCEILRLLAVILSIVFIAKARHDLALSEVRISEHYFLRREHDRSTEKAREEWLANFRKQYPKAGFLRWPAYLYCLPELYPAIDWYVLPGPLEAQTLWDLYRNRGHTMPRLVRSGRHVILYAIFCVSFFWLPGTTFFEPTRGALANRLDGVLLVLAIFCFLCLNFLVADAVRLARTFIRNLTRANTVWPSLTLEEERTKMGAARHTDVIEWMDIQFIGSLTKSLSGLVFYPAIVLCLLILARTHYFDNWQWPWWLALIFACNACWPLVSAFLMQTAAVAAREDALQKLDDKIAEAKAKDSPAEQPEILEILRARVENYSEGAFTSYLDNPALKALLVPFTGAGVMNIVNVLTSS